MEKHIFICDVCGKEGPCNKYVLPLKDFKTKDPSFNKAIAPWITLVAPKEVDLCKDCEFFIASAIEERKEV